MAQLGGQGGSSVVVTAWYWSNLWKDCYEDSTAVVNCVDLGVLWRVKSRYTTVMVKKKKILFQFEGFTFREVTKKIIWSRPGFTGRSIQNGMYYTLLLFIKKQKSKVLSQTAENKCEML